MVALAELALDDYPISPYRRAVAGQLVKGDPTRNTRPFTSRSSMVPLQEAPAACDRDPAADLAYVTMPCVSRASCLHQLQADEGSRGRGSGRGTGRARRPWAKMGAGHGPCVTAGPSMRSRTAGQAQVTQEATGFPVGLLVPGLRRCRGGGTAGRPPQPCSGLPNYRRTMHRAPRMMVTHASGHAAMQACSNRSDMLTAEKANLSRRDTGQVSSRKSQQQGFQPELWLPW